MVTLGGRVAGQDFVRRAHCGGFHEASAHRLEPVGEPPSLIATARAVHRLVQLSRGETPHADLHPAQAAIELVQQIPAQQARKRGDQQSTEAEAPGIGVHGGGKIVHVDAGADDPVPGFEAAHIGQLRHGFGGGRAGGARAG